MTNILLATKTIEELIKIGVQEFILCAGARNSPFMFVFEKNNHLNIQSFFDERSAAFYAIGKIQSQQRPVAIITTSGTAVSETISAMVESHYTARPLIIVSADRPKSYRGQGAPQSIEHIGIFSHYVEKTYDLDVVESEIDLSRISLKRPIHINVCFDEPLIDGDIPHIDFVKLQIQSEKIPQKSDYRLNEFLQSFRPLVILGQLDCQDVAMVRDFLIQLACPIYAEAISNLREDKELQHLLIRNGDYCLGDFIQQNICDAVLRIGGVPTIRLWRDLESQFKHIPVFSLSRSGFSGLSRSSIVSNEFAPLVQTGINKENHQALEKIRSINEKSNVLFEQLFNKYPQAEASYIHRLSRYFIGSRVYLGNSLPIREWDSFAQVDGTYVEIFGNRGANGIDGQISTMLGWANEQVTNVGIFGDLTSLYDLNAFWASRYLRDKKCICVVINNGGGKIFQKMFGKEIFLNRHQVEFSYWAKMWNWDYHQLHQIEIPEFNSNRLVVEVLPDEEQTLLFQKELEEQWKRLSL